MGLNWGGAAAGTSLGIAGTLVLRHSEVTWSCTPSAPPASTIPILLTCGHTAKPRGLLFLGLSSV